MPPAPSKRVHDEVVFENSSSKRAKTSDTDSTLSSFDSDGVDTDDSVAINVDSDQINVDSDQINVDQNNGSIGVVFDYTTKFSNEKSQNNPEVEKKVKIFYSTNCDDIFANACRIGKLDDADLDKIDNADHRKKLEQLRLNLRKMFKDIINNWLLSKEKQSFELKSNPKDPKGNYGLLTDLSKGSIKYGMSNDCISRVKDQSHVYAFKVVDSKFLRMDSVIGSKLVKAVEDLGLPGIEYHRDHSERTRDVIVMQVFEAFLTAAHVSKNSEHECITRTILERFVQEPPLLNPISRAISCPKEKNETDARSFLKDLHRDKVYALLSWPTMKTHVLKMAIESHQDYLNSRIRKTPGDFFVTNEWIKSVFRDSYLGFEDVVKDPPRKKMLDEFISEVSDLLAKKPDPEDERTEETFNLAIEKITGDNRESYFRPEPQELAEGFVTTFTKCDKDKRDTIFFYVERNTLLAVKQKKPAWFWNNITQGGNCVHLPDHTSLYTTTSGRRLIVTPSYFLAFSPEEVRRETRINTVKALINMFHRVHGDSNPKYIVPFQKVLVSYLMTLDRSDDNRPFRSEARYTMPEGYMMRPLPNCVTVSNNMGLDVWCHFYLQFKLGEDKFRHLLYRMGMLLHCEEDKPLWPSHPEWKCGGPPAFGNIEQQACNSKEPNKDNLACMVGGRYKEHPFRGHFLCEHCHRKMEPREMLWLEKKEKDGQLSEQEAARLQHLISEKATNRRNRQIEERGAEPVLRVERLRELKNPRNKAKVSAKNKVRDAHRPNRSGPNRNVCKTRERMPYPEEVVMLFENAILKFFKKYPAVEVTGVRSTFSANLKTLFGLILDRKWSQLPREVQDDGRTSDGKPKWRSSQIKTILLKRYLEEDSDQKNYLKLKEEFHHLVSGDNADVDSYGIGQKAVFEEIVEELCGTETEYQYREPKHLITNFFKRKKK